MPYIFEISPSVLSFCFTTKFSGSLSVSLSGSSGITATNCIAAVYGSLDFFINILGQLAGTKNNNTMVKHPFVKNMKIADPPEYDEKNQKTYA